MAQALHSGFVQAIVRVGYCPFLLLLLTLDYISLLYATPVVYLHKPSIYCHCQCYKFIPVINCDKYCYKSSCHGTMVTLPLFNTGK